jgi:hypothetical protein
VRLRANSSNWRAWLSSAALLGTGSVGTDHQRKATRLVAASQELDDRAA